MKNPLLPILVVAWIALLSLVGVTGWVAVRGVDRVNDEIAATNARYQQTERNLAGLQADLDGARIGIRDYMLDPDADPIEGIRKQFRQSKSSIDRRLDDLTQLLAPENPPAIAELRTSVHGYFDSLTRILDEGPRGFPAGTDLMRDELSAHRMNAANVARQIGELNDQNFLKRNAEVEQARRDLSAYLTRSTAFSLALGVVIAILFSHRVLSLQRRDHLAQQRMANNEVELRRLSGELVRAQEDERKSIARELHDEVGQTLTALGIEIGNIERLRTSPEFSEHVADAKALAQQTLKTVRNLAMGLRPSMLDDSGLIPALRWQAREFSKRTNVAVDLQIDGDLDDLPGDLTTCIYRVVQEALTNCARHAHASNIRIYLHGEGSQLAVAIQDDGVGFNPVLASSGAGILGIEERVRELGGTFKIDSQHHRGTLLTVSIPLRERVR